MSIQGFYIITEDCIGEATHPDGWSGPIEKGTPVFITYFDEYGMEFSTGNDVVTGNRQDGTQIRQQVEFRLEKPCPVVPACSCDICSEIVPTNSLQMHKDTNRNCKNIQNSMEGRG